MGNFDENLDKAVEKYEKGFDKAAGKAEKVIGVVGRGANRLYIGCITIFANLFFCRLLFMGSLRCNR